jgi:hypothetical protein
MTKETQEKTPVLVDMADLRILVRSANYWGIGHTLSEALSEMKKIGGSSCLKQYQAFLVHKDSYCEDIHGWIMHQRNFTPREIYSVGIKKPKQKKATDGN